MPARVIPKAIFEEEPDLTPRPLSTVEFQDCAVIMQAFERGAHMSASEQTIFAPITKSVQNIRAWAQSQQDILQSWLEDPNTSDSEDSATKLAGLQIENTFTSIKDDDFGEAMKKIYEDCVPCNARIDLGILLVPPQNLLDIYIQDIKDKIKFLTDLDGLLSDVNVYGDICRLVETLNFMCVPDLQRMISVLMALLMKFNLSLDGLFTLISSLIVPLLIPVVSGITNLLSQYEALVLGPMDCVIESIQNQIGNLSINVPPQEIDFVNIGTLEISGTTPGIDTETELNRVSNRLNDPSVAAHAGIGLLRDELMKGEALIRNRIAFYVDQLNKMTGDINGDGVKYLSQGLEKLQVVRLIALIAAIIDLKRKGGQLCLENNIPSISELNNFFDNFLNPNSIFKLHANDDGTVKIEEPDPILYELETSVKIISYEPDDLLQKPVSVTIDCGLQADPAVVEKINKLIKNIDKAES